MVPSDPQIPRSQNPRWPELPDRSFHISPARPIYAAGTQPEEIHRRRPAAGPWRKTKAVPNSLIASRQLVGGLALSKAPSWSATSDTLPAPRLKAIRLWEPSVLMATGNGDIAPFTVGFSNRSAFPPSDFFISRS